MKKRNEYITAIQGICLILYSFLAITTDEDDIYGNVVSLKNIDRKMIVQNFNYKKK